FLQFIEPALDLLGRGTRRHGKAAGAAGVEATRALEKSLAAYGPKVLRDVRRAEVDLRDGKTIYRTISDDTMIEEGTRTIWFSEQCEFFYTLLNGGR
ncbi:hypothetical protein, partial [Rhizobium johnstonii]|uniref:hypothetical protein n=1 Tax=Rhizobium johnstonii TaxID=3019933 RepID=UPI003F9B6BE1